jgi:hypothetical protein
MTSQKKIFRHQCDVALLHELLSYDPETGALIWKPRAASCFVHEAKCASWNTRFAGKLAGHIHPDGYRHLKVSYQEFVAHRVIWAMQTGAWPEDQIDHIDGNKSNNAWANLRPSSDVENRKNMPRQRNNTSGVVGVVWFKPSLKWRAYINVDAKSIHLGYFVNFDDAVAARKAAEERFGFHENHGRAA